MVMDLVSPTGTAEIGGADAADQPLLRKSQALGCVSGHASCAFVDFIIRGSQKRHFIEIVKNSMEFQ